MGTFTNYNSQFTATQAMKNYVITSDVKLKSNTDYQKICKLMYKLIESGVTFVGKGYCISMSDIIYTILKQNDIPCKIVECHLSITNKVADEVYTMGFDGLKDDPSKADTHVVVVTETEVPLVIDLSIAHLLPNNLQGVIDSLDGSDNFGIFANIKTNEVALTYQSKKAYSIPMLHQRSIVDRIKTDVDIFNSLKFLKYVVVVAFAVSFLNASRGFYDFYQVYINDTNSWGPSAVEKLLARIDSNSSRIDDLTKRIESK